jgi:hypothetical protein
MSALRRSISSRCNGDTRDRLPPTRFFRGSVRSFTMGDFTFSGLEGKIGEVARL